MNYYRKVELVEGAIVQYVGVYVLRWRKEWGEPTFGFVGDNQSVEVVSAAKNLCTELNRCSGAVASEAVCQAQAVLEELLSQE